MSGNRDHLDSPVRSALNSRLSRRRVAQIGGGATAAAALGALPRLASAQATPDAGPEIAPYNGEKVKITYGYWDTAQSEAIDAQIKAFNAEFPDITVEPQIVPWADYWTQLQTAVAGGETFDVFWINTASLPVYASVDALLPITSIVGDGGIDPALLPAPLVESYAWNGVQYGLPRDFDTIALFYNKDIFDAAGVAYPDDTWTWETFRSVAEQLNDADNGVFGAGLQTSWQENYYNFIWQNEGRLLNDDFTASLVGEQPASEAFEYLTEFFTSNLTPSIAIQQSNPVADTLFPAGQVALLTGGSFRAGTYAKAEANIDVAPLPQGKKRATAIHGLANVIWASTENPGAALEWVKFLAGEEGETILGESGATIPAYSGLAETWVNANPDLNLQAFIDATEYSVSVESPPVGFQWQVAIQEVVIKGWSGDIPANEIGT
ncbi:MAG: ABC transporter substrate-binding protein, partial [Thermomicrobiales bacterium]